MLVLGCSTLLPQFTERLKTGILNVALDWTFQIYHDERGEKLEFSRLGW